MTRARLVVFDLDGTLVNSARDLAGAVNALIAQLGGRPLPLDAVVGMVGDGAGTLVRRTLDAAGVSPNPPDALERFLAIYDKGLLVHTVVYDGVMEALRQLNLVARLAVLTNKPTRATARVLAGLGLDRFFGDAVVAGDGPFPCKPDPAGLLHLITGAGATAATTTLVGDSANDLETARRAGTRICLVRWGYGVPLDRDALRPGEIAVSDPRDLAGAITDWSR